MCFFSFQHAANLADGRENRIKNTIFKSCRKRGDRKKSLTKPVKKQLKILRVC